MVQPIEEVISSSTLLPSFVVSTQVAAITMLLINLRRFSGGRCRFVKSTNHFQKILQPHGFCQSCPLHLGILLQSPVFLALLLCHVSLCLSLARIVCTCSLFRSQPSVTRNGKSLLVPGQQLQLASICHELYSSQEVDLGARIALLVHHVKRALCKFYIALYMLSHIHGHS